MQVATTDKAFNQDVIESSVPVLVDFWATWCGPCKQMAPALSALADKKEGSLIVATVNIDDNPETPSKYGVRGIPTMMLFVDGNVIATRVGAMQPGKLEEWVSESLSNT